MFTGPNNLWGVAAMITAFVPNTGWRCTSLPVGFASIAPSPLQALPVHARYAGNFCRWTYVTCVQGTLTGLSLKSLNMKGSLPSSLYSLTTLTMLSMSSNSITGTISSVIGQLANLEVLDLSFNLLTGQLDSRVGNLTKLTILDVSFNRLTSRIPSSISKLASLERLNLNVNYFNGTIPSDIGLNQKLIQLYLLSNQLTGKVPSTLCGLQKAAIDMSQNPGLTCYESCWRNISKSQLNFGDLRFCAPSSEPTVSPTAPTFAPTVTPIYMAPDVIYVSVLVTSNFCLM